MDWTSHTTVSVWVTFAPRAPCIRSSGVERTVHMRHSARTFSVIAHDAGNKPQIVCKHAAVRRRLRQAMGGIVPPFQNTASSRKNESESILPGWVRISKRSTEKRPLTALNPASVWLPNLDRLACGREPASFQKTPRSRGPPKCIRRRIQTPRHPILLEDRAHCYQFVILKTKPI